MDKTTKAECDIPRYAAGKSKRALEMSKQPLTCGKCGKTFRRIIDLIHHQSGRRECQQWREANLGRQVAAANKRITALEKAARAVVEAAPGYTARRGSVWKLDHALDALRAVLDPAALDRKGED